MSASSCCDARIAGGGAPLAKPYGSPTGFGRSSAGMLLRCVDATVHHLVVSDEIVERRQSSPGLRLDDRDIGIVAGKSLDGLDRVPQGHGEELHLATSLTPEQVPAP